MCDGVYDCSDLSDECLCGKNFDSKICRNAYTVKITVFSAVMVKITYRGTVSLKLQILCKKIAYAAQNLKVLHSQQQVTLGQSAKTTATNANA